MRKIPRFLDSVKATFSPSGSVYYGPIMSIDLNTFFYALPCKLYEEKVVEEIQKSIVAREVKVKRIYTGIKKMPWYPNPSGSVVDVGTLMDFLGKEGWPGYDSDIDGLKLYYGIGRFGREVYALCPASKETNVGNISLRNSQPVPIKIIDPGTIEICPIRDRKNEEDDFFIEMDTLLKMIRHYRRKAESET